MKLSIHTHRIALGLVATAVTAVAFGDVTVAQETMMKHGDTMTEHSDGMTKHSGAMTAKAGLDGYCPVCVVEHSKWEKGNPKFQSTFDGVSYQFPNDSIKRVFDSNPQKYVPALNGDCIVCLEKAGKRVPGKVQHAALHHKRLYLFPSDGEKQAFLSDPGAYANTDLAINGECIVCLAKADKHVTGSAKHTVIHNGLRYQFPSAGEAIAFRQTPDQFISKVGVKKHDAGMMKKTSMKSKSGNGIRLVGRSGCAACEFGVTPLTNPDELGLAIVGKDGHITVVEGAHKNYPRIYEDRFEGKQLAVEGKIVKTQDGVSWLEPSSLMIVN